VCGKAYGRAIGSSARLLRRTKALDWFKIAVDVRAKSLSLNVTKKKLPAFKTEDQERNFWATADSTEYLDWSSAKRTKLVRLKPTLKTISLRLPLSMIQDLKILANRRDVPYQSLLKVFLAERLARERQPRPDLNK